MKCPLRVNSEGTALECYREECAWWIEDAFETDTDEIGACAVLDIAVNGIHVYVEEGE